MTFLDAAGSDLQFQPVSRGASRLGPMLGAALAFAMPVLALAGLGALEGYLILSSGWSPGFAVALVVPQLAER